MELEKFADFLSGDQIENLWNLAQSYIKNNSDMSGLDTKVSEEDIIKVIDQIDQLGKKFHILNPNAGCIPTVMIYTYGGFLEFANNSLERMKMDYLILKSDKLSFLHHEIKF